MRVWNIPVWLHAKRRVHTRASKPYSNCALIFRTSEPDGVRLWDCAETWPTREPSIPLYMPAWQYVPWFSWTWMVLLATILCAGGAGGGLGPLGIWLRWCHLRSMLNSIMTVSRVSRTLTPHARTRFENLTPKYLYQEIFINFCLFLVRTHNYLLYHEKPVFLLISCNSKTTWFETKCPKNWRQNTCPKAGSYQYRALSENRARETRNFGLRHVQIVCTGGYGIQSRLILKQGMLKSTDLLFEWRFII